MCAHVPEECSNGCILKKEKLITFITSVNIILINQQYLLANASCIFIGSNSAKVNRSSRWIDI